MRSRFVLLACVSLAACVSRGQPPPVSSPVNAPDVVSDSRTRERSPFRLFVDPGASELKQVREAVAVLTPTVGNDVRGVVRFRETPAGLQVFAVVSGLSRGRHAYHVHVYGDCTQHEAKSAGPHFHFAGSSFDRGVRIITGNLGELKSDGEGITTDHTTLAGASLQGRYSIIGRSVVVHAQPDDLSQPPDGAAGERLACGAIGISGEAWQAR